MSQPDSAGRRGSPDAGVFVAGIRAGDRGMLARAITLLESRLQKDRLKAQQVLQQVLPHTGNACRIGISGVPGVGKSTFIEALGRELIEQGHRLAVLAVDPSSSLTGGSILGDKSRMPRLAADTNAFIRPSPNVLSPGGVGHRTRESLLLCEAAGFDVVLVETVGVGQAEIQVADMVDFFLVLLLADAGDELQGIKKGILERADLIAINKADGENVDRALRAQREYKAAFRYLSAGGLQHVPPIRVVSGRTGSGVAEIWRYIEERCRELRRSGALAERRRAQSRQWLRSLLEEGLRERFLTSPGMKGRLAEVEQAVEEGRMTASRGAEILLDLFSCPDPSD